MTYRAVKEFKIHDPKNRSRINMMLSSNKNPGMRQSVQDSFERKLNMRYKLKQYLKGTLQVGKHKHKTYEWVFENDPKYCKWVVEKVSKKPLLRFKEWLILSVGIPR